MVVFGKVERFRGRSRMTNPVVDLVGDRTGRIVPVYPQSEKAGLSSWEIGDWVAEALRRAQAFRDPLPESWRQRLELPGRDWAMRQIHAPDSLADSQMARRRLAFDELLRLQVILVMRKRAVEREAAGIRHRVDGELVGRFRDGLPFTLTAAQDRAIAEIQGRHGRPASDAPALAGRRRLGQDRRRGGRSAHRRRGRPSGRADGSDRGARRAAPRRGQRPPQGLHHAERRHPAARPPPAGRAAHQPHPGPGAGPASRRAGRRHRRPADRHPCAADGGGVVPVARGGRDRRAAPLRGRAARRPPGQRPRPGGARRAGDDRYPDPPDGRHDRVRRPRHDRPRRAPAGADADRRPDGRGARSRSRRPGIGYAPRWPPVGRPTWSAR